MTESLDWDALWDETEGRYRVMTRDGRKARVYTRQGCNPLWPVVGEVQCNASVGNWRCVGWTVNGRYLKDGDESRSQSDLIPEPRTVRRWVNVYPNPLRSERYTIGATYLTEVEARAERAGHAITTVPIKWEENGHG